MSKAKERPILFNDDLVRSILEGRKTETRRPCQVQPKLIDGLWHAFYPWGEGAHGIYDTEKEMREEYDRYMGRHCPFGQAGDQLYVREAWHPCPPWEERGKVVKFRADGMAVATPQAPETFRVFPDRDRRGMWRPSIHMPRWAARLVLDVLSVEAQRLHDITEDGAKAEGVRPFFERFPRAGRNQRLTTGELAYDAQHRASFAVTWDDIYGRKQGLSWKDNPMVRVVAFDVADESRKLVETYRARPA